MEMGGINNLNLETLGMLFSNIKKIHYNLKMVPFEKNSVLPSAQAHGFVVHVTGLREKMVKKS